MDTSNKSLLYFAAGNDFDQYPVVVNRPLAAGTTSFQFLVSAVRGFNGVRNSVSRMSSVRRKYIGSKHWHNTGSHTHTIKARVLPFGFASFKTQTRSATTGASLRCFCISDDGPLRTQTHRAYNLSSSLFPLLLLLFPIIWGTLLVLRLLQSNCRSLKYLDGHITKSSQLLLVRINA